MLHFNSLRFNKQTEPLLHIKNPAGHCGEGGRGGVQKGENSTPTSLVRRMHQVSEFKEGSGCLQDVAFAQSFEGKVRRYTHTPACINLLDIALFQVLQKRHFVSSVNKHKP